MTCKGVSARRCAQERTGRVKQRGQQRCQWKKADPASNKKQGSNSQKVGNSWESNLLDPSTDAAEPNPKHDVMGRNERSGGTGSQGS